jgi:phenylpyruvate tautomerase PptA (4-oxalocrotonate tautomerase family)/limonene-1,2-epoxide hydrolase
MLTYRTDISLSPSGRSAMPIVSLDLPAGCDEEAKARLARAVTAALLGVIDAAPEAVTVTIRDLPREDGVPGGARPAAAPVRPDPVGIVRAYLAAMEARDLDRARAHLAPGFTMTFPGGVTMTRPEEVVAWAAPRYRFVTKSLERFDAIGPVVYCCGRLAGEWPDGTPFRDIRFVDRFEIGGGLILRQEVWNDLGEARGGRPRGEAPG